MHVRNIRLARLCCGRLSAYSAHYVDKVFHPSRDKACRSRQTEDRNHDRLDVIRPDDQPGQQTDQPANEISAHIAETSPVPVSAEFKFVNGCSASHETTSGHVARPIRPAKKEVQAITPQSPVARSWQILFFDEQDVFIDLIDPEQPVNRVFNIIEKFACINESMSAIIKNIKMRVVVYYP